MNNLTRIKQTFGLEDTVNPYTDKQSTVKKFTPVSSETSTLRRNINTQTSADVSGRNNRFFGNTNTNANKANTNNMSNEQVKNELQQKNIFERLNNQPNTDTNGNAQNNNGGTTDLSSWNAEKLKKTDLTQLPKLNENQVGSIINQFFSSSDSVVKPSDAAGICQAQNQSGISALALLGIGALESGFGTSNIAKQKGNLWGWGAVNSNPMGGAKTFSSNAGSAAIDYANNLKSLYYDQRGAKSIYAIGTGENPSGLGYAYLDDEKTIDRSWQEQVGKLMEQFTQSLGGTATVTNSGENNGAESAKGSEAVNIAKQYLGTPYVWGGESPDGFDCSGLMQYVYNKLGYNISRTTYTQINDGSPVSKENLQPGDLVFFGDAGSPHHVGMYIGNGQYLHAPQTGDVVKISDLNARSDFAGARRIVS